MEEKEVESFFEFFNEYYKLKHVKRTGWVDKKINDPETISGHMYSMAMMAICFPIDSNKIDRNKCIKMALVHDLGECIAGDITPHSGISLEKKFEMEKEAFNTLLGKLPEKCQKIKKEIFDLWIEFETGNSEEAKFVRDLDKLDMMIQANQYEKKEGKELDSFYKNYQMQTDIPSSIFKVLMKKREDRIKEEKEKK